MKPAVQTGMARRADTRLRVVLAILLVILVVSLAVTAFAVWAALHDDPGQSCLALSVARETIPR